MLEALLLIALPAAFEPLADALTPAKPSVELLEFLGEFSDDEAGLLDDEPAPGDARKPARATAPKASPPKPAGPATPAPKEGP